MEYFDGAPIDDLSSIEAMGLHPRPFVEELLQAWILCGLLDNVFHADIHAGNLILLPEGQLGMVDWGIVARLDESTRDVMQGLVEASLGDESAWERIAVFMNELQGGALQSGLGLTDHEVYLLVRNMMEPVLTRPLSEVSMGDSLRRQRRDGPIGARHSSRAAEPARALPTRIAASRRRTARSSATASSRARSARRTSSRRSSSSISNATPGCTCRRRRFSATTRFSSA